MKNSSTQPSQWYISRNDKNEEQYHLELLQKHFDQVTTFENHPDVMLGLIWSRTFDEVCGKNFNKERVPKRKQKLIKEKLLLKLRNKYGRWINLTNLKFKGPHCVSYQTNFNRVYKVKDSGTLYGSPNLGICGDIFLTSHCLERFEERVSSECYEPITEHLKQIYKSEPTSYDNMVGLILSSNKEYALKDGFCYLNIRVGVLVLENLGDVFIAKTFLTPKMLKEMDWLQPLINDEVEIESFVNFLELDSIKIREPIFLKEEIKKELLRLYLSEELE